MPVKNEIWQTISLRLQPTNIRMTMNYNETKPVQYDRRINILVEIGREKENMHETISSVQIVRSFLFAKLPYLKDSYPFLNNSLRLSLMNQGMR